MLDKIRRWTKRLTSRYPDDPKVTVLRVALLEQSAPVARGSQRAIAVQCLEDRFYFGLFGAICQHLREAVGAFGELVIIRSISGAVGNGWQHSLARSSVLSLVISRQWIRAFRAAAHKVAYRSLSLTHPLADAVDWFRSRALWRQQSASCDIASLQILGVQVGDLIIDSYLRFRPSPRFECGDPFVLRLIWQVHRDIRRARRYFRSRRPHTYLTSYSTYIEHGIAVRVALQEGVRVRSFGSFLQYGKELTLSDWFHTPDTSAYRTTFQNLDGQAERLAQAEQQLKVRLAGGIDAATSYMRVSAYAPTAQAVPDVAGAVIVFLHDFYDSPHVYGDLVFRDFWEWTCFTLDTLSAAGRKFFVKPHPNQISLSASVLTELQAKYPRLPLLPQGVTTVQLVEQGIACGVTVYGTVAHELAYLGVPTIACAKHPHHSFDFCRTARTVAEYASFLRTADELPISIAEMRRQALEFYYMHNFFGDADQLSMRRTFAAFWSACNSSDASDAALLTQFRQLRESPAFKSLTEQLL